jgi:type I restriction enzyme M protein
MAGDQFPDFLAKQKTKEASQRSWSIEVPEIEKRAWDLTARNPNRPEDDEHRPALELVRAIRDKEERILALLGELEEMLESQP